MWIGHRSKEIWKLRFWVLALRRSDSPRQSDSLGRSDFKTRNGSFRIFLRFPIHVINPVDKTQLSHKKQFSKTQSFLVKSQYMYFEPSVRDHVSQVTTTTFRGTYNTGSMKSWVLNLLWATTWQIREETIG